MTTATIHFDGGTRPTNPGPSAIGYVIEANNERIEQCDYIGKSTNNEAEYQALIQSLNTAQKHGYNVVEVYGDSQLIVKQVRDEWAVNKAHLQSLRDRVQVLISDFEECTIQHVQREKNKTADKLVEQAFTMKDTI